MKRKSNLIFVLNFAYENLKKKIKLVEIFRSVLTDQLSALKQKKQYSFEFT